MNMNEVLATLATERTDAVRAGGAGPLEALTEGYQLAFIVAAGLVVGAIVLALTVLRSERAAAAEAEAQAGVGDAEPAYSEAA
jgi:hypothetical protein